MCSDKINDRKKVTVILNPVIFHIDVNSAFLSWEAVYRLGHKGGRTDLREIPSAVAGDTSKRHGIILAKSIPAKKYGIQTGQAIWEAKQKCPDLILVPPNYNLYQNASQAMMEILGEYTPQIEPYSIDEAFLDMTGTQTLWGDPMAAAGRISSHIRQELGFTVNVGVSENKLLAKMASDFRKPDQVHSLFRGEIRNKMWILPVSDLFFVGRQTTKKLHRLGIRTIGELAGTDPAILRQHLKSHGQTIWNFANGRDVSVVESIQPANKGYGNSTTAPFDIEDPQTAKMVLLALSETLASRLRKDRVKIQVVSVGIKSYELAYSSHQMILDDATNITRVIHQAASRLFDELWDGRAIRHLGIHTSRVCSQDSPHQLNFLDETDYEKLERFDAAVDAIRGRYGMDSLIRAPFIESPVDHMEGGVSREKRTVDYHTLTIE
ncbi:MAG: DNA polymerase Y family protein [Lachnospiraceae bacterium]